MFQLLAEAVPGARLKVDLGQNPAWADHLSLKYSYVLSPPLPLDETYALYKRLEGLGKRAVFRNWNLWRTLQLRYAAYLCNIRFAGYPVPLSWLPREPWQLSKDLQQDLINDIFQLLKGRILQEQLLFTNLRQKGWWPADISRGLATGAAAGSFVCRPGAIKYPWGMVRCSRCNGLITHCQPCTECGRSSCPICLTCETMGPIRGCSSLWALGANTDQDKVHPTKVGVTLNFSLTLAQTQASTKLVDFLHSSHKRVLVWAACGAGKTEVTFAAIEHVLSRGEQVLFAIPRRDIVVQLAERINRAFSDVDIAVHYGGRPWDQNGQLVIATTHQVLRFDRRFALVILDEVDAFPYQGSEILRFAIGRSLKPDAQLIEMTATPDKLPPAAQLITIPARYHGKPLPEPSFLQLKLADLRCSPKEFWLPEKITGIIQGCPAPWLVFVPTVAAVGLVAGNLSQCLSGQVCGSHAADPNRDRKRDLLFSGKCRVMVATSIMERGITLANIQVMVLYCDHPVFSANSLIQMAGRVGRTAEYATGDVWFISQTRDEKISTAKKRIAFLNQLARAEGLIGESGPCG